MFSDFETTWLRFRVARNPRCIRAIVGRGPTSGFKRNIYKHESQNLRLRGGPFSYLKRRDVLAGAQGLMHSHQDSLRFGRYFSLTCKRKPRVFPPRHVRAMSVVGMAFRISVQSIRRVPKTILENSRMGKQAISHFVEWVFTDFCTNEKWTSVAACDLPPPFYI